MVLGTLPVETWLVCGLGLKKLAFIPLFRDKPTEVFLGLEILLVSTPGLAVFIRDVLFKDLFNTEASLVAK